MVMAPCGSWVHISSSVLMPGEEKGLVQGPRGSSGLCGADFQPKLCHLSIISFLRPHPPSVVEVGLGEQGKFALVLFCLPPPQPPTLGSWHFGAGATLSFSADVEPRAAVTISDTGVYRALQ